MQNCANCKNQVTIWEHSPISRTCSIGNTDAMKNWWLKNGGKTRDMADDMPCFQDFEGNAILRNISEKLAEMNQVLGNHKKIPNNE